MASSEQRETISSRFGFIMLAAGCAIGLGNVWRFPYITGYYGGACFVLLYLFFLFLLGFPLMVMELAVGRASRRGLYGACRELPEHRPSKWRIPAGVLFTGNLILMMMYTTVTGWMLYYFYAYCCGHLAGIVTTSATSDFFNQLLNSPLKLTICMLIATLLGSVVCSCGLRTGVERVSKFMMALLFILLVGLCIYALTLPQALQGVKFYLWPDFERFFSQGWWRPVTAAMNQAFFTLSIGIGSITIFGSYLKKDHTLTKESLPIIGCDTLVALLSGLVIFSACASFGVEVNSGPGLVLISLTRIFNHMAGGRYFGLLFFLFMSMAALTTVIAVFENLVAFMLDEWHFTRRQAAALTGVVVAVLSIPCVLGFNLWKNIQPFGENSTILDLEDWIMSGIMLPIGSLFLLLFCTWRCGWGWDKFVAEANTGSGRKFPGYFRKLSFSVLPGLILILIILDIFDRFIS